jgi:hypothetical protein
MDTLLKHTATDPKLDDVPEKAVEAYFATEVAPLDRSMSSRDPAERLSFSRPPTDRINRFDWRADKELREVAFSHPSSLERERAAWEYGDRHQCESLPILESLALQDPDPSVRWTTLWLMQKIGGAQAGAAIESFADDEHPEVRDWARLLLREITGRIEWAGDPRPSIWDETNPFDQTLPLQIAGFARTLVPGMGWVQATLSPQWFESIMGRVMACTRAETFDTELTIEKRIRRYHPDGSDHCEIYGFRGFTFHPTPGITHHVYECQSRHTFYPSGKLEDMSIKPIGDVGVVLNRVAEPTMLPLSVPVDPQRVAPPLQPAPLRPVPVPQLTPERAAKIVHSVRGRFMGAAYVNIDRLVRNGMKIGPGEVQLSSLNHPIVGQLTNTFLFGTFKGKLSDLNDDGVLDVNTERCHATVDGKLDYDLRGAANPDPFDSMGHV